MRRIFHLFLMLVLFSLFSCNGKHDEPVEECQHVWGETIVDEATCQHPGKEYHICTLCSDVEVIKNTDKIDHGYSWTGDDNYHWQVCGMCGQATDAVAHKWDSAGGTKYECSMCGGIYDASQKKGDGGIDVHFLYRGPECTVSSELVDSVNSHGYHNVKFTVADDNADSDGMTVIWKVFGCQVRRDDNCSSSTYTLNVNRNSVFDVSVVWFNSYGGGNYVTSVNAMDCK